jgi:hypothetical protein
VLFVTRYTGPLKTDYGVAITTGRTSPKWPIGLLQRLTQLGFDQ